MCVRLYAKRKYMEVKENPKLLYSFGFFVYICVVLIKRVFMEFKYKIENNGVTITGHTDKSVKSINIPEFIDDLPVTNIGNLAFYQYRSIKEIIIPNSVTNIDNDAFCGCSGLMEVDIPNSVTNINQGAFCYCTSLKDITIPNSVINICGSAFYHCTSLKVVIIPDSVTNISGSAFYDCKDLTQINGVKLKGDINLIHNRFIYYKQMVYKIRYGIDSDYYCENKNIFINGKYVKL